MKKTAIFLFASMLSCLDLISQEVKSIERGVINFNHHTGVLKESDKVYVFVDYEYNTNHIYAQKLNLDDMSLGTRVKVSDPLSKTGNNYANGVFVKNHATYRLKTETTGGKSTVFGVNIDSDESFPIHSIENVSGEDVVINHTAQSPNAKWTVVHTTTVMPISGKDKMRVGYSKPREDEFYRRKHLVTVFDENGREVWQKQFYLGGEEKAEYVYKILVSNVGALTIEVERTAFRNFFAYLPGHEMGEPQSLLMSHSDVEDVIYTFDQVQSEPKELKSLNLDEFYVNIDRTFRTDKGFIRIASLSEDKVKGAGYNTVSRKFLGFMLHLKQGEKEINTFIPISAENLRTEFSDKQSARLEKGKGIQIGTPEPFFAHYSDENGLYIFLQEYSVISSSNSSASETYYNYVTIMNISDQGKINWTSVNDIFQQIDLSSYASRGGAAALAREHDFVVVMNSAIRDDVKFMGNSTGKISTYYFDLQGKLQKTTKLDVVGAAFKPLESFAIGDNLILFGNPIDIPLAKSEKASVSIIKP